MKKPEFRVWTGSEMEYDIMVGKFGVFYVNKGSKGDGLDAKDSASLTSFNTKYPEEIPVMQFTGRLDKKGKKIWGGDIVRTYINKGYVIQPIRYVEESASFVFGVYDHCTLDHFANVVGYRGLEVIGNIYKNPELLDNNF